MAKFVKRRQRTSNRGPRGRCPCCFYLTLTERAEYETCPVCGWEDDGQDDKSADEVWGGPNGNLSLTQARYNFARIGATDWDFLSHRSRSTPSARVPGAPFAEVQRLNALPPLESWPDRWTLSFHPRDRETSMRWRDAVRLLTGHGFRFQGVHETKACDHPEWTHPRFRYLVEFDDRLPIGQRLVESRRALVGAWFSGPREGGVQLKLQSV